MILGNLGQDPDLRHTQSGQAILNLSVATNESFQNKDGERQERTEWHKVAIWGKRAEGLAKILTKGKQLYIEGRLQTQQWEDKQGNKRYTTQIVATEVILLGGARGGGRDDSAPDDAGGGGYGGGDRGGRGSRRGGGDSGGFQDDDDIPF
jgi:single-strand DNA-binding protein